MNKLSIRLTLALSLVALVAIVAAAGIATTVGDRMFSAFLAGYRTVRAEDLESMFGAYYEERGSWAGVQTLFRRGPFMMHGRMRFGLAEHIILADADGVVVADSTYQQLGQKLSAAAMRGGLPVQADGVRVGTLIVMSIGAGPLFELEVAYRASVRQAVVTAGAVALLAAIVLGSVLSRRLLKPIAELSAAADAIASRDLSGRVSEAGEVELAELARSFNRMAESLAQSEEARRRLVADVAHELRTPLSVIRGHLERLQADPSRLTEAGAASLHDEALRMSRLVEDLQDLSLAEAGRLALSRQPVDLNALIRNTLAAHGPAFANKGVQLTGDLPGDIPVVEGDADRLSQVLGNLLANSLRHTPPGGQVMVSARLAAGRVTVTVADAGEGIAAADLPHIFDRFYRADPARQRGLGAGAGLGLAIARGLVEAQRGRIWVDSVPGEGTRFHFDLPAGEA